MTGLVFTKFLEAQKKLCEFHSRMQIRFQNTTTLKLFIQKGKAQHCWPPWAKSVAFDISNIICLFTKSYFNEEVKHIEFSPLVSVPWFIPLTVFLLK